MKKEEGEKERRADTQKGERRERKKKDRQTETKKRSARLQNRQLERNEETDFGGRERCGG